MSTPQDSATPPLPRTKRKACEGVRKSVPKQPKDLSPEHFMVGLFESRARVAVLRILFGREVPDLCISEIVERACMAEQGVDEQLRRLAATGLLLTRLGRNSRYERARRFYRANVEHAAFPALQMLVLTPELPAAPL